MGDARQSTPASNDRLGSFYFKQGDSLAIVQDERHLTWAQYIEMRNRAADALLQVGIKAKDRVVVYGHNSIEWLLSQHVCAAIGAVFVPCNWRLSPEEVQWVFDNSEAACVIFDDELSPVIDRLQPTSPNVRLWVSMQDTSRPYARSYASLLKIGRPIFPAEPNVATMIYTGGTSGKPKAALRNKPNSTAGQWLRAVDMHLHGRLHLCATPLYHSAPNAMCSLACMMGGTVVMLNKFDARKALQLIERYRVTSTYMPPVLIKRLISLPADEIRRFDTSSLKVITCGGAPCPQSSKEAVLDLFGPIFYEFYGSTEMGINTVLRPEDVLRKPGSCGRVLEGVEMAIFDEHFNRLGPNQEGELFVRRYPGMFEGYYGDEEKTKKAFKGDWASVGDVAMIDEEGFVFIMDRKIDLIISGGVNIYPAEVENAMHQHPAVEDVAVFGTPDDEFGENVHAAVQLKRGATATSNELIEFTRQRIARFKTPKQISFHDELPRTEHGKILKRKIRDPYWTGRKSRL